MKLYKDENLTQETNDLDLGIVSAGNSKDFIFYLYNDVKAELTELSFTLTNSEVKVIEAPKILQFGEKGILKIRWTPSITLKQGLKTDLVINGYELYGG